ncbi:hypothetical protein LSAT2_016543 [Lamellibrachia satsuma]|nr:hypothetical protein LSAT2_016543 [Lamellibrachia satsuma]
MSARASERRQTTSTRLVRVRRNSGKIGLLLILPARRDFASNEAMAKLQRMVTHLTETGGTTCMSKWLMGTLLVLTALHSASCRPIVETETDTALRQRPPSKNEKDSESIGSLEVGEANDPPVEIAPSSVQNNVAPPTADLIVTTLIASTRTASPGVQNSNPDPVRFQQGVDQVAPSHGNRVLRGLEDDIDEFTTAWKNLDWQHHWTLLLLTMLVSSTTLVLVSIAIAVTCGQRKSEVGSSASLDTLRMQTKIKRQILAKRYKAQKGKIEEMQSLLEQDVVDSTGHRRQSCALPATDSKRDLNDVPARNTSSQKHDKAYISDTLDSEPAETVSVHKKPCSRRHKPKTSTSSKRDHRSLRHEMVGIYK